KQRELNNQLSFALLAKMLTPLGVSTTRFCPTTNDPLKHEFQKNFELEEAVEAMDILLNF
ncbi:MAG: hypothetical protein RR107_06005, partial [Clostridia bacterium]